MAIVGAALWWFCVKRRRRGTSHPSAELSAVVEETLPGELEGKQTGKPQKLSQLSEQHGTSEMPG
ncbi:hypothetical protein IMZ48_47670 [Candidatus Bathyarchaeota archaeon]|nr:hypothetical protein [Candidatus Bathyarchaeota archaeon]